MLHELRSQEFRTFTQKLRAPKDDYERRKVQKDRMKLKGLLEGLLNDREVIIFYRDGEEEKMVLGTCKKFFEKEVWPELPTVEPTIEIINNKEVPQMHHCRFWEFPSRTPMVIHFDNITKFIIHSKENDEEFFRLLKHTIEY